MPEQQHKPCFSWATWHVWSPCPWGGHVTSPHLQTMGQERSRNLTKGTQRAAGRACKGPGFLTREALSTLLTSSAWPFWTFTLWLRWTLGPSPAQRPCVNSRLIAVQAPQFSAEGICSLWSSLLHCSCLSPFGLNPLFTLDPTLKTAHFLGPFLVLNLWGSPSQDPWLSVCTSVLATSPRPEGSFPVLCSWRAWPVRSALTVTIVMQ